MKRKLTIEIDAGDTTCYGCREKVDKSNIDVCQQFLRSLKHSEHGYKRLPECLAAEQREERWGCHCDLDPGMTPDDCVVGGSNVGDCIYAARVSRKEDCEYWRKVSK